MKLLKYIRLECCSETIYDYDDFGPELNKSGYLKMI
jgi:hypothetical protein